MNDQRKTIELRPYQAEVVEEATSIIRRNAIVYLSMEVRTGKTITALEIAKSVGAHKVLFVTKKKAMSSIMDDIDLVQPNYHIYVINYASLHKVNGAYDMIIVDEAHSLGAFPKVTKRTKALREIVKRGTNKAILMSGTPTPESWSQIYHQFWIFGNGSPFAGFRNFYRWADAFVSVTTKNIGNRHIKDYSNGRKDLIMKQIQHLFIDVSQKDAGFVSAVNEKVLYSPPSDDVVQLFRSIKNDKIATWRGLVASCTNAADRMNKLHQLCGGTLIFDGDNGEKNYQVVCDSKARFIKKTFSKKKIAVIYKFKSEFDILKKVFDEWTDDPNEFNEDNDLTFLGQVQSVREGVSLRAADCLVMYSIDFSATSYWQIRARSQYKDRASTDLYWIFSQGLFEDKILSRVVKKKNFTSTYYNSL